jgi:hypothetical protein
VREVQNRHQPEANQHPYAARDVGGGNPLTPPLLDLETAGTAGGVETQYARKEPTRAAARAALSDHTGGEEAKELHGPSLPRFAEWRAQNPATATESPWMRWSRARRASTLFEKLYWGL